MSTFLSIKTHLCCEGRAATAGPGCVGVFEMKPRELEGLNVVDFGAVQILKAHGIDEDLEAVFFEDKVAGLFAFVKVHVVAEPRTTATNHHNPQTMLQQVLLFGHFLHFCNCFCCNNHLII